jgi:hypothetical protein
MSNDDRGESREIGQFTATVKQGKGARKLSRLRKMSQKDEDSESEQKQEPDGKSVSICMHFLKTVFGPISFLPYCVHSAFFSGN